MNTQLILLVQPVTGAVIEIILLLVGAALIGFFTAWYYQKSHYVPIVEKLETEKAELNKRIDGLNSEIARLKSDINGLNMKIADLEKQVAIRTRELEELKTMKH